MPGRQTGTGKQHLASENGKRMWIGHQTQQGIINKLQESNERVNLFGQRATPWGKVSVSRLSFFWRRFELKENR